MEKLFVFSAFNRGVFVEKMSVRKVEGEKSVIGRGVGVDVGVDRVVVAGENTTRGGSFAVTSGSHRAA